jgi:hypothetical protein
MSYKGYFKPKNPNKYLGDPTNIIYRSLWELKLMGFLDTHPEIVSWASEEVVIPYRSPVDNRLHRYFPDFVVKKKTENNVVETLLIEIKPESQVIEPKRQKKPTKRYIKEVMTYGVNQAKWKAAERYCKDRNWKFIVMTEHHLGIK